MTIFVCNGFGKGKTTSAIGTTLRALSNGEKVLFIQFLKDGNDLALKYLNKCIDFKDRFIHIAQGLKGFDISNKRVTIDFFNKVKEIIDKTDASLIVLDELNVAQDYKLLGLADSQLLDLLKTWAIEKDLYITGRLNRYELRHAMYNIADIATNMRCEAHSFNKVCKDCGMEFTQHYIYCPICGKKLTGGHRSVRGREY